MIYRVPCAQQAVDPFNLITCLLSVQRSAPMHFISENLCLSCAVVLLTQSCVMIDANLRVAHQYLRSTALARSRTRSYDLRLRFDCITFVSSPLSRLRSLPPTVPLPTSYHSKPAKSPSCLSNNRCYLCTSVTFPKNQGRWFPPHAALQGSAAVDVSERAAGKAHRRHRVGALELCNSF
jgi:hypothetical protein